MFRTPGVYLFFRFLNIFSQTISSDNYEVFYIFSVTVKFFRLIPTPGSGTTTFTEVQNLEE